MSSSKVRDVAGKNVKSFEPNQNGVLSKRNHAGIIQPFGTEGNDVPAIEKEEDRDQLWVTSDDPTSVNSEMRRERNRLSAKRCRERKRQYVQIMEERISALKSENAAFSASLEMIDPDLFKRVQNELRDHRRSFPVYIPGVEDNNQRAGNPESISEAMALGESLDECASFFMLTTVPNEKGETFVLNVSPNFQKATGYSPDEALGRDPSFLRACPAPKPIITPNMGRDRVLRQPIKKGRLEAAVYNGSQASATVRHFTKSGTPYWASVVISPLRDINGDLKHFARYHSKVPFEIMKLLIRDEQARIEHEQVQSAMDSLEKDD